MSAELGPVPALVLAGGLPSPEFAAAAGVEVAPGGRARAELWGRPMVAWVLRALRQAELVSRVALAAPSGFPDVEGADLRCGGDDGSLVENIRAGLACFPEAEQVLLVTADLPYLTPAAVDDFVRQALAADVDICYAAIPEADCVREFPGMKRTYLRTPATRLTGGNVVLQRTATLETAAAALAEAHRRRKSPAYLARLIGTGSAVKLLFGRLTVPDIERGASRALGVRCRLLVVPHAGLGTDVDRPEDLLLARQRGQVSPSEETGNSSV